MRFQPCLLFSDSAVLSFSKIAKIHIFGSAQTTVRSNLFDYLQFSDVVPFLNLTLSSNGLSLDRI